MRFTASEKLSPGCFAALKRWYAESSRETVRLAMVYTPTYVYKTALGGLGGELRRGELWPKQRVEGGPTILAEFLACPGEELLTPLRAEVVCLTP